MVRFILGRWLFRRVSMSAPGGYDPEVYSRSVTVERVYQNEQAPGFSPGMLLLCKFTRFLYNPLEINSLPMNPEQLFVSYMTIVRKEVTRFLRVWKQTIVPPVITTTLYYVIF